MNPVTTSITYIRFVFSNRPRQLTKLQKERRAEEQAAALERTWLASLAESEEQAAETKSQLTESASFRKSADASQPQPPSTSERTWSRVGRTG
jgi:hypothetical protein